jgi:hypothetical protein
MMSAGEIAAEIEAGLAGGDSAAADDEEAASSASALSAPYIPEVGLSMAILELMRRMSSSLAQCPLRTALMRIACLTCRSLCAPDRWRTTAALGPVQMKSSHSTPSPPVL